MAEPVPDAPRQSKRYTTKQLGDACEMLVAAELTLAGIPALKVPDNWPGYDVLAQPSGKPPQRISVKGRTYRKGSHFVDYYEPTDDFDWLAVVLIPGGDLAERRIYIISRADFDAVANEWLDKRSGRTQRYIIIARAELLLGRYRDNFSLRTGAELLEEQAGAEADLSASPAGGEAVTN